MSRKDYSIRPTQLEAKDALSSEDRARSSVTQAIVKRRVVGIGVGGVFLQGSVDEEFSVDDVCELFVPSESSLFL